MHPATATCLVLDKCSTYTHSSLYSSSPCRVDLCLPVDENSLTQALSRSQITISPVAVTQTPVGHVLLPS